LQILKRLNTSAKRSSVLGNIPALLAPMDQADRTQSDHTNEKYHWLLLKLNNNPYICRLCPRDNELRFDDDEEALHHITKSHLDMGYGCSCGWYVDFTLCGD